MSSLVMCSSRSAHPSLNGKYAEVGRERFLESPKGQRVCTIRFPRRLTICKWQTLSPIFKKVLGVGYIGNSRSAFFENLEDALSLSQVLGGIPVITTRQGDEVEQLLSSWSDFFASRNTVFIQYCYGDGICFVDKALSLFSLPNKVVVVGIEPPVTISHMLTFYYCFARGIFSIRENQADITRLPVHPATQGFFSLRFSDPTFFAAIQSVYLGLEDSPVSSPKDSILNISPDVAAVIGIPPSSCCSFEATIIAREEEENIFCHAQRLMRTVATAMRERDPWSAETIHRASQAFLAAIRVTDYVFMIMNCHKNGLHVPIKSALATMIGVNGLAQVLVVTAEGKSGYCFRTCTLQVASVTRWCDLFDFVYNTFALFLDPCSEQAAFSLFSGVLIIKTVVIRSPILRQLAYDSVRKITAFSKTSTKKVRNSFRSGLRSTRIVLHILFLLIVGNLFVFRHFVDILLQRRVQNDPYEVLDWVHYVLSILLMIAAILAMRIS